MATNIAEPKTELDKYKKEADELASQVEELEKLHFQRDQFAALDVSLKLEREELNGKVLDSANPDGLLSQLEKLEAAAKLNAASSEAIAQRIAPREKALQDRLPPAIAAFSRLSDYVSFSVLEDCRAKVRSLIAPGYSVAQEHVDQIAIAMPDYVKVSQLRIPAINYAFSRPLDAAPPVHWNSMTRPYREDELAAQRLETVKSIVATGNALILAARGLIVAAGPYAEGCPPFELTPEEKTVPAFIAPQPTPVASTVLRFEDCVGPFDDGRGEVQKVVDQLRKEDPSLTLMTVNQALFARRPDLFKPRAAYLSEMQTPLPPVQPLSTKAEMIGSTYASEPSENDSLFGALNQP